MTAGVPGQDGAGGFRPLAGVRVADFSTNMAGPYATMILAQLGADVVKIEPPAGDDARAWPPHIEGVGIVHRHMNAGKRGIVLDLAQEGARAAALRIAARADVLLQSMRPGVAERIGIGEAAVRQANPGILYYALNAFGGGPAGGALPGYDPLVQAFSGIMRMTGHEGTPPARCAPSVIDLGTGQWVAMGVLAAILARHRGQPARAMETALVDTAFSLVPYQATTALMTGQRPKRAGSGNPIAAPYQVYAARDGELMLAAPNQRLWERVAQVLGAPELCEDPRFLTVAARSRNNAALDTAITARLAGDDVENWIARFRAAGVPVTRVGGLEESVGSEIACERETFREMDSVPLVRLPWMVDGAPLPAVRSAPRLGEHTAEVLLEVGCTEEELATLLRTGAAQDAERGAAAKST
jgi:crotonobetainyl-CoA:carnitine CoA-transferase CaiB-like acyl-CoA transferase